MIDWLLTALMYWAAINLLAAGLVLGVCTLVVGAQWFYHTTMGD